MMNMQQMPPTAMHHATGSIMMPGSNGQSGPTTPIFTPTGSQNGLTPPIMAGGGSAAGGPPLGMAKSSVAGHHGPLPSGQHSQAGVGASGGGAGQGNPYLQPGMMNGHSSTPPPPPPQGPYNGFPMMQPQQQQQQQPIPSVGANRPPSQPAPSYQGASGSNTPVPQSGRMTPKNSRSGTPNFVNPGTPTGPSPQPPCQPLQPQQQQPPPPQPQQQQQFRHQAATYHHGPNSMMMGQPQPGYGPDGFAAFGPGAGMRPLNGMVNGPMPGPPVSTNGPTTGPSAVANARNRSNPNAAPRPKKPRAPKNANGAAKANRSRAGRASGATTPTGSGVGGPPGPMMSMEGPGPGPGPGNAAVYDYPCSIPGQGSGWMSGPNAAMMSSGGPGGGGGGRPPQMFVGVPPTQRHRLPHQMNIPPQQQQQPPPSQRHMHPNGGMMSRMGLPPPVSNVPTPHDPSCPSASRPDHKTSASQGAPMMQQPMPPYPHAHAARQGHPPPISSHNEMHQRNHLPYSSTGPPPLQQQQQLSSAGYVSAPSTILHHTPMSSSGQPPPPHSHPVRMVPSAMEIEHHRQASATAGPPQPHHHQQQQQQHQAPGDSNADLAVLCSPTSRLVCPITNGMVWGPQQLILDDVVNEFQSLPCGQYVRQFEFELTAPHLKTIVDRSDLDIVISSHLYNEPMQVCHWPPEFLHIRFNGEALPLNRVVVQGNKPAHRVACVKQLCRAGKNLLELIVCGLNEDAHSAATLNKRRSICAALKSFKFVAFMAHMPALNILLDGLQRRRTVTAQSLCELIPTHSQGQAQEIQLTCSVFRTRMRIPGRIAGCQHLDAFDMEAFLKRELLWPRLNCPICGHRSQAGLDGLCIDMVMQHMLTLLPTAVDRFLFRSDGHWRLPPPLKLNLPPDCDQWQPVYGPYTLQVHRALEQLHDMMRQPGHNSASMPVWQHPSSASSSRPPSVSGENAWSTPPHSTVSSSGTTPVTANGSRTPVKPSSFPLIPGVNMTAMGPGGPTVKAEEPMDVKPAMRLDLLLSQENTLSDQLAADARKLKRTYSGSSSASTASATTSVMLSSGTGIEQESSAAAAAAASTNADVKRFKASPSRQDYTLSMASLNDSATDQFLEADLFDIKSGRAQSSQDECMILLEKIHIPVNFIDVRRIGDFDTEVLLRPDYVDYVVNSL